MEDILNLYEKEYDSDFPVIVFDERPCQLIDDVISPLPMKGGKVKREDYHYKRNGACSVLLAFEPLTGFRFAQVREHRTKKDYGNFMNDLSSFYRYSEKIILIQDNLNTHTQGSFYECFSSDYAFNLSQKFDMHYTPKHASWLNMAEIELSALSKQCLDRRIGSIDVLTKEISSWVSERNKKKVKVKWEFTKEKAREKLKKHYDNFGQN